MARAFQGPFEAMRADSLMPAQGRVVASSFQAHPWLPGAHAQTITASLLRSRPEIAIRRERLELDDGDFVDLGWCGDPNVSGPIAVLVHGLTGDFESKYLRGTARQLVRRGWRCVLLQLRGAGPEPNRSRRYYNHGDTIDLRHLWHRLRERELGTPIYSVGWSLGANVTLKALAEEGDNAPVSGVTVACAPFQLKVCAEKLRTGFSRVYQHKLLKELKASLRRKHATVPVPEGVDLAAALAARDFFEFDDAYVAPLNGYRDALDYYAQCSSGQFLKDIRRPTLIINALDDPFMTEEIIPSAGALAEDVTLELSENGGHVGFIGLYVDEQERGRPEFWLERRFAEHLNAWAGGSPPGAARSD